MITTQDMLVAITMKLVADCELCHIGTDDGGNKYVDPAMLCEQPECIALRKILKRLAREQNIRAYTALSDLSNLEKK